MDLQKRVFPECSNYRMENLNSQPGTPGTGPVPSNIGIVISQIESLFGSDISGSSFHHELKTPLTSGVVKFKFVWRS